MTANRKAAPLGCSEGFFLYLISSMDTAERDTEEKDNGLPPACSD
jgi:hypothetical protein